LPTSAMDAQIDYGMFTIPLRYSACTIKVWLYRGTYLPKRTVTFGKWQ
jgi:ribosomal protein S3